MNPTQSDTPTPRTDKEQEHMRSTRGELYIVSATFARQLERELQQATVENARYIEFINKSGNVTERGNLVGEIQALRARVDELERDNLNRYAENAIRKAECKLAQAEQRNAELAEALDGLLSRVKYDKDAKTWWPDAQQAAVAALARHRAKQEGNK